jgi:S-formylglutathione hydrolase FrmB
MSESLRRSEQREHGIATGGLIDPDAPRSEAGFPRAPFIPGPNWFRVESMLSRNVLTSGTGEVRYFESSALRGNFLNDPSQRPMVVYLPASYDREPRKSYPVVYVLHGAMTDVGSWLHREMGRSSLLERMDQICGQSKVEAILVLIDGWTSVGGSQYLNSPAVGRYHDYFVDDVTGFVDAHFRTVASAAGRAVLGHSSGGFGAWNACVSQPDVFAYLAMLAPDCLFEGVFLHTLAPAIRRLREQYEGSMEVFWASRRDDSGEVVAQSAERIQQSQDTHGGPWNPLDTAIFDQHMLAAAFAHPSDDAAQYLFWGDGRINASVWARWLEHDPVRSAHRFATALRELQFIGLSAGSEDEFFADNGAASLAGELGKLGVGYHLSIGSGNHEPGENFDDLFRTLITAINV